MEGGNILFDCFNNIDDEMFESSATHADTPKGINAEQLSKVWRVSNEFAQQTLDVTTHLNNWYYDSTLSHRFSTINLMLRYKILESLFYTDTNTVNKFSVNDDFQWCSSLLLTKVLSKYTGWHLRRSFWKLLIYFQEGGITQIIYCGSPSIS